VHVKLNTNDRTAALPNYSSTYLHDVPHRVVALVLIPLILPTAFSLFFSRPGDKGLTSRVAAFLPSTPSGTKLILSLRADFAPRNGVRKNISLDSRSRNPVSADDTRGSGKRAMTLEDSFEPNTTLDIIDVLSVIPKKLGKWLC
jgi:hypothetical protein